jgi:hypothetical protein
MRRFVGLGAAFLVVVLSAVAWLSSCGGGTGAGPASVPPPFVLKPVGTSGRFGTFTMGVSRSSVDANNADRVDVFARILDPDQRPLGGVAVVFQASFCDVRFLDGRPDRDTCTLDNLFPTGHAVTDGNGLAVVTVKAGGTAGRLIIGASAPPNVDLGGAIFLELNDVGFISGDLQVLPAEIDLTDPRAGTQLEFLVVGGEPFRTPNPPYMLQNPTTPIGTAEIVDDGQFPVVIRYTVSGKQAGAHVFTVVDAAGHTATGTVMVTITTLVIQPTTATVVSGGTVNFALTGGIPPYTCTPSGGTLNPTTITDPGGTTVFTAGTVQASTTVTIICTDVSGQIATAQVTINPGPGQSVGPSPTPVQVATIVVQPNPASLNGTSGGTSDIVATALDQNNNPIPGVNVLFQLTGPSQPTPDVPTLSNLTAPTGADGKAVTVLTVPAGTPPQFLVITASAGGASGTGQVSVTSQGGGTPGPPARLTAALFKANGFGDNNDGTFVTVLSALVSDANGNPVADGVEVDWGPIVPSNATVFSPSFTNGLPPCDVTPYESNTGLAITAQPGTALTCVIYPRNLANLSGSVTVKVKGTNIQTVAAIVLPGPVPPTPTPAPPTPTPVPTPTKTPTPTPTPAPTPTPTPTGP